MSQSIRRLFTTEAQAYLRARGLPISRLGWAQKYGVGQRFGKRWWFTPQALDLITAGCLLEEIASRLAARDVEAA
jgi:hypothetical protein